MASQTANQSVLQSMKVKWTKAVYVVRLVTKPAKQFVKKVAKQMRCCTESEDLPPPTTNNIADEIVKPDDDIIEDFSERLEQLMNIKPEGRLHYLNDEEGIRIFNTVDEGQLAVTDIYIRHIQLSGKYKKRTLIWTDKRLIVVVSDTGKVKWEKLWPDIDGLPRLIYCDCEEPYYDEIVIPYKQSKIVFHVDWDFITLTFTLFKRKVAKVLPIKEDQLQINKFFYDNNQFTYCDHY